MKLTFSISALSLRLLRVKTVDLVSVVALRLPFLSELFDVGKGVDGAAKVGFPYLRVGLRAVGGGVVFLCRGKQKKGK